MAVDSKVFDIAFVGHMCFDEVIPFHGEPRVAAGSAVLCGAMAAARVGKKVLVITQMSPKDDHILDSMRKNGIEVFAIPSTETTYMKVVHSTANVDERQMYQLANAGFFSLADFPKVNVRQLHLAGITDQEFDLAFIKGLKDKDYRLSVDMQSFVRQVDPITREVAFLDVTDKAEIVHQVNVIKLDIVEAKILTGTSNLEQAALTIESWGCSEILITNSEGVLARIDGNTYFEKFSNQSVVGRTGRGDTTFAAYLARRLDHDVTESLKFAAALVSIKMETPGPFCGSLDDILLRMRSKHSG